MKRDDGQWDWECPPGPDDGAGPRIRPLRGRAWLELHESELEQERMSDGGVWIPATAAVKPRDMKIHRGRVIALGEPMRQGESGPEVPWGIEPGDEVLFVYAVWLEKMRRFENQAVVAQSEIVAAVEP